MQCCTQKLRARNTHFYGSECAVDNGSPCSGSQVRSFQPVKLPYVAVFTSTVLPTGIRSVLSSVSQKRPHDPGDLVLLGKDSDVPIL